MWSSSSYEYLGCHSGHTAPVTCLALDANFLFSGSDDATIRLWDTVPAAAGKPGSLLAGEKREGGAGVRVKREKPCKASGNRGSAGACTRRESGGVAKRVVKFCEEWGRHW